MWKRNREHKTEVFQRDIMEEIGVIHRLLRHLTRTRPRLEGTIIIHDNHGLPQEVVPMSVTCTPNDTIQGGFVVRDADGDVVDGIAVTFESDNAAIVAVTDNGDGTYSAVAGALGTAGIVARFADLSATLEVQVQNGPAALGTFTEPVLTTVDGGSAVPASVPPAPAAPPVAEVPPPPAPPLTNPDGTLVETPPA
jgi:hypothetical protein